MPAENTVMRSSARVAAEFGVTMPDGTRAVPLIPLFGDLRREIVADRAAAAIPRELLDGIGAAAVDRLELLAVRLASEHGKGWMTRAGIEGILALGRRRMTRKLVGWMADGLGERGLLR
jgi:hypothetical protein